MASASVRRWLLLLALACGLVIPLAARCAGKASHDEASAARAHREGSVPERQVPEATLSPSPSFDSPASKEGGVWNAVDSIRSVKCEDRRGFERAIIGFGL